MRKQGLSLVCCCFGIVALAACGSSSKSGTGQLTLSQFVAKADPICASGNAQRKAIPAPPGDPTTAGPAAVKTFAPYLSATSASLHSELQQIRALGTPKTGGSIINAALALGDRNVAVQEAVASAAAKGNVAAFRTGLTALSSLKGPGPLLKPLGFKVCGNRGG
jgi:hypothetical protein